jgi:hypothetical protein
MPDIQDLYVNRFPTGLPVHFEKLWTTLSWPRENRYCSGYHALSLSSGH